MALVKATETNGGRTCHGLYQPVKGRDANFVCDDALNLIPHSDSPMRAPPRVYISQVLTSRQV
jgi:hypothetical protein